MLYLLRFAGHTRAQLKFLQGKWIIAIHLILEDVPPGISRSYRVDIFISQRDIHWSFGPDDNPSSPQGTLLPSPVQAPTRFSPRIAPFWQKSPVSRAFPYPSPALCGGFLLEALAFESRINFKGGGGGGVIIGGFLATQARKLFGGPF